MKKFKLIDSTYSAEDAREVLLSLISDKIQFLNTQSLSTQLRFSGDGSHFKERAAYLEQEAKELRNLFQLMSESGKTLAIKCDVEIREVEGTPEVHLHDTAAQ